MTAILRSLGEVTPGISLIAANEDASGMTHVVETFVTPAAEHAGPVFNRAAGHEPSQLHSETRGPSSSPCAPPNVSTASPMTTSVKPLSSSIFATARGSPPANSTGSTSRVAQCLGQAQAGR